MSSENLHHYNSLLKLARTVYAEASMLILFLIVYNITITRSTFHTCKHDKFFDRNHDIYVFGSFYYSADFNSIGVIETPFFEFV